MLKVNKYLVEQAIASKNPLEHYSFFYNQHCLGEISTEYWEKYCLACLMSLQEEFL